ncbi:hypothetical protein [Lacisediminihabitans sp. H27-G8]|uniref:hypothetical protein n=1 Tax=Lacisediminihabitans sp. H27-G8 TaxID=3111909 RepID=UPI0038FCF963
MNESPSLPTTGPIHDTRAFKFQPRNFVQESKQFGQSSRALTAAKGVGKDDPRFLAAQLQHHVANAARESMLAQGYSLRSYVDQLHNVPGMSYERLVRIQRGETLMQFADLMAWASRFGAVKHLLTASTTWPEPT